MQLEQCETKVSENHIYHLVPKKPRKKVKRYSVEDLEKLLKTVDNFSQIKEILYKHEQETFPQTESDAVEKILKVQQLKR